MSFNLYALDTNEIEIVRLGGLEPIIEAAALSAEYFGITVLLKVLLVVLLKILFIILYLNGLESSQFMKEGNEHIEELGAQCARALRNLSVNREFVYIYITNPARCLF